MFIHSRELERRLALIKNIKKSKSKKLDFALVLNTMTLADAFREAAITIGYEEKACFEKSWVDVLNQFAANASETVASKLSAFNNYSSKRKKKFAVGKTPTGFVASFLFEAAKEPLVEDMLVNHLMNLPFAKNSTVSIPPAILERCLDRLGSYRKDECLLLVKFFSLLVENNMELTIAMPNKESERKALYDRLSHVLKKRINERDNETFRV